jgi:hypothetical protein
VDRNNTVHGRQSTAGAVAKHLKQAMGEPSATGRILNALTIPGAPKNPATAF